MYPVRHRGNRNLIFSKFRPNNLPHPAGHSTVKMAYRIAPAGHAQREDRHVERITELSQVHELLLGDAQIIPVPGKVPFHHMEGKGVMACRHWCVRCEKTCRPNLLSRFFESEALLDELARSLEQHK